jgi:magnesium transporter
MYELMLASSTQKLESVMLKEVFTLDPFVERVVAAEELSKRRYFAAPVVDGEGHLLGVIRAEQLIGDVKEEISQDIQKMFGVSPEERAFSPIATSLRRRLPWLHVNLLTAFLAAGVVAMFEGIIAQMTALAIFLPVVAGQGGNAGAQSLAIVMRGLVMREIPKGKLGRLVWKEALLGTISGAVTGIVTGLVAWGWQGNAALGVVVGLGMLVNLFAAGLAGASIPVLMKSLGWDPAQCSSIILTTVTDVVGFFAFLGFAVVFQGWLM